MARSARLKSSMGIYHVMMRGINRQNIFFDDEDRLKFMACLHSAVTHRINLSGRESGVFEVYAFALMSNHFHILVKVISGELGEFVKKIASSYVMYFNKKYNRDGHLFKERFKSETCETADYLHILFRYIHQNPLKAGITTDLLKYKFTSWAEYADPSRALVKVCNVDYFLQKKPIEVLTREVYEILPENNRCLDTDKTRGQISDACIIEYIKNSFLVNNPFEIKQMPLEHRRKIILDLLNYGASVTQIDRLTGIDKGTISRAKRKASTK